MPLITTSASAGVWIASAVAISARYWMYRDCRANGPGTDRNERAPAAIRRRRAPVRTLIASVVPAGTSAAQLMFCQLTAVEASNTRERNVPALAYGVVRTQSTTIVPLKALKSLAATGRIGAGNRHRVRGHLHAVDGVDDLRRLPVDAEPVRRVEEAGAEIRPDFSGRVLPLNVRSAERAARVERRRSRRSSSC